jgi:hypothetical protein
VNQLRQLMLEELQRRNFAATTIRTYLHGVAHFSRYFRRPPDQLGPALCANMSETSRPSTITVGRGKRSHFDEHKQDKYFFRCVGSFGA